MAAGTENLVEAARESDVRRIVLMSALGTGPGATVPDFRAKWAAEQKVRGCGIDHVILRPSFVFGTDGGVLPRFLRIARLAPVTPVIGPGTQRVQPIWIDDLVRAVHLAVHGDDAGEPVELGGPEAVTWNELWGRMKTALGTRRPAINVPFWLARGPAALLERLPSPPLTRDRSGCWKAGQHRLGRRRVDAASRARRSRRARRAAGARRRGLAAGHPNARGAPLGGPARCGAALDW